MTSLRDIKHYRISFKHWKTGEVKTIDAREIEGVTINDGSDRIVVWNITEGKFEDIIRDTIESNEEVVFSNNI